jgi:NADP-dependent 3-hydroxy acid dehydrogenase YdfG
MSAPVSTAPGDRAVVVTGASSGVGEATARLLAASGHPVVLGARRVEVCERVADEIRAAGGTAHAALLDLADEASIIAFAKSAESLAGPIDVLVSNAGLAQPGEAMAGDSALFEQLFAVNVIGARALVQAIGARMVARGHGDLVFVTSEVLRAPRPGIAPYVASKFALEGLVTSLMLELEGTGVRVSTVRPGATLTEMGFDWDPSLTGALYQDWERRGLQRHSHFMAPADVAAAIAAAVGAPQGVVFRTIEVEPLAPVTAGDDTARGDRR